MEGARPHSEQAVQQFNVYDSLYERDYYHNHNQLTSLLREMTDVEQQNR